VILTRKALDLYWADCCEALSDYDFPEGGEEVEDE
jgi:hypothetical protein